MNKSIKLFFGILALTNVSIAQNLLNKPEHVVYDQVNHRYLVTNYGNGKIISIDTLGNQEAIIEGIPNCLGIHIVDTTIFITEGAHIHLYGLQTLNPIQTLTLAVTTWIDGMANDDAGNLFVAENAGRIHKVDLATLNDTIIVNSGLPSKPQDLAFDPMENRLLLVCWGTNSPIVAIDLATYAVSDLVATTSGQYDGIVRDEGGNLYVTSWMNGGRVYKWEPPYTAGPEIFSQGHPGPAGLALNGEGQLLAVPNFNGNLISYLSLVHTGIGENNVSPVLRIEGDRLLIKSMDSGHLLIHDMSGKQLIRESYASGENRISLKQALTNHCTGVYLLSAQSDMGSKSIKYFHTLYQ